MELTYFGDHDPGAPLATLIVLWQSY